MARLTFLGTSNAFGHGGRNTSCYLLQGNHTILIDAGYSLFSAVRAVFKTFPKLDGVLISHLHPDHYMGLPQLILEDYYVIKRGYRIPVYGPIGLKEKIYEITKLIYSEELADHVDKLFKIHEFGINEEFVIPGGSVLTLPAIHSGNARMQIITFEGTTIGYTGDTSMSEDFHKLLDCDIVITEASSKTHKIPDHITLDELTELNIPESKRFFLSHLGETVIKVASEINPPFYLTYDGLQIEI